MKETTKKAKNYEVNANGNRSFSDSRKSAVMDVYRAWKRQGHRPKVYAIGDDNGKVFCDLIAE